MRRQHSAPILIDHDGLRATQLIPFTRDGNGQQISEDDIQAMVEACPSSLPIAEIDPVFANPVSICRELGTPAGPIDNFLMTASGLPVIVECKLWRNPEGRREVIGQILDYAKELSKWSCSDLQREVSRRLKQQGNLVFEKVSAVHPGLDEITFNDAVTHNLRRGRFLLLIVGDGIRENVEAIADYIRVHSGLHFSLGLVEMPIFQLPDGRRLATPRILAKTLVVTREVVTVKGSEGMAVVDAEDAVEDAVPAAAGSDMGTWNQAFWTEFQSGFRLDDPELGFHRPMRLAFESVSLSQNVWLSIYRNFPSGVGVFIGCSKNSPLGQAEIQRLVSSFPDIKDALGGTVVIERQSGRNTIGDHLAIDHLDNPSDRQKAIAWLRERTNTFVNVIKPLLKSWAEEDEG